MTGTRLLGAVAGALAIAASLLPAAGVSSSDSVRSTRQECGHGIPAYNTGPELVFGRVSTIAAAETLQQKVLGAGFTTGVSIEEECDDYKVVLRGYDTFDTAVALQEEATLRTVFRPTVECYQAPDNGGDLEAVLGYGRDLSSSQALQDLAASRGYVITKLEPDPCGGYEVIVTGFTDSASAESFVATAYSIGFDAHLETDS